ncbi:hypothetical protein [Raineyella sp. LH-20]|uniref:hypothetical protein n=1 Tax=Raineyella sp. LH-20 TaxID=3081204 RepID=UPI0029544CEC|nr:hypothetical protein [Raineyella sp. LH-20]WOP20076.1 hypothetical protein R0146_07315 [Raineyella sp. LH-20]
MTPVSRVELIVGLDYPRWFSLQRLVRRTIRRLLTGEEICNGNRETWGNAFGCDSIIRWHFQTWRAKREQMRTWARDPEAPRTLLFGSPAKLGAWIDAGAGITRPR